MKYIGHNQWNGQNFPNFYNKVVNSDYDKIIIFGQNEWEWYRHDPVYWPMLQEHCKKIGKPIHVITGAHHHLYPVQVENTEVSWWGTYWMGRAYQSLINQQISKDRLPVAIDPYESAEYKYHYISMNNRAHEWRCKLIDIMSEQDIMKYGAISIHQNSPIYQWKHFDYKPMILESTYPESKNQHVLPDQYYQSFAQLISESAPDVIIVSEKTAIPLIIGKPFLVASQIHFHRYLSELGFQMYDEIFDYSFDDEPDEDKRYSMIVENFKRLTEVPLDQLQHLQRKIADKVAFNKQHIRKIAYDMSLYPQIALDVIEHHKKTGEEIDHLLVQNYLLLEEYKPFKF